MTYQEIDEYNNKADSPSLVHFLMMQDGSKLEMRYENNIENRVFVKALNKIDR